MIVAKIAMAIRHETEATGDVLLIGWKWLTEHNAVDMVIFVIAVNFGEKWRLKVKTIIQGNTIHIKNASLLMKIEKTIF